MRPAKFNGLVDAYLQRVFDDSLSHIKATIQIPSYKEKPDPTGFNWPNAYGLSLFVIVPALLILGWYLS